MGRVLGQGGFGITYVAFDPKLRQKVAIKEYLPEALCTRTPGTTMAAPFSGEKAENFEYGKQSFLDEARTLAALGNVRGIAAVRTF
ncbi:MAG: serine/threonine protein kinase, partial [Oscillospiraceae bacterium]|nr:serine/threonine protein kinase [Oscillospiraceae bacterium]